MIYNTLKGLDNVLNDLYEIQDVARSTCGDEGYDSISDAIKAVQHAWNVCKNGMEQKGLKAIDQSRRAIKSGMSFQEAVRDFKQQGPWNDYYEMQLDWTVYIDGLADDGIITKKQRDNWGNPCTPSSFKKWLNSSIVIKSSEDKEDEDTVDEKMRSFINQIEKDFHCEVFDNFGKSSVYLKLNSEPDVIKKLDYKKSNGEYQVSGEPVDFITKEDIENELDALMSKKKFGLDKDTYEETVEYILSFFEEKYFPDSAKQAVADWYNDTVQFFPEMFEKGEKRKLASAAYLKKIRSSKLIKSSRRR